MLQLHIYMYNNTTYDTKNQEPLEVFRQENLIKITGVQVVQHLIHTYNILARKITESFHYNYKSKLCNEKKNLNLLKIKYCIHLPFVTRI